MIACQVVVPLVSERSRAPWHANKVENWEFAVAYLFGGISPLQLGGRGLWRNEKLPPHKGVVPDPQNRYEIAVEQERVSELREFIRFSCVHFEQECMYFKLGGTVEIIDNPLGWP